MNICDYDLIEQHKNVYVDIAECEHCGNLSISWIKHLTNNLQKQLDVGDCQLLLAKDFDDNKLIHRRRYLFHRCDCFIKQLWYNFKFSKDIPVMSHVYKNKWILKCDILKIYKHKVSNKLIYEWN